jgi:hypothetical protein
LHPPDARPNVKLPCPFAPGLIFMLQKAAVCEATNNLIMRELSPEKIRQVLLSGMMKTIFTEM